MALTIDRQVQAAADAALDGKKGAIVAMDVRTGDILALSSAPRFDPNIFTGEISKDTWLDLVAGKDSKLTNRAVQGAFPPGSVFKIFVAIAGLSEQVVNPQEQVYCPGFLQFGKRAFRCHKHSGHGNVGLFNAIVESCDVYFYTLGQRLGVDRIHDYAALYGFGESTDFGLVEENPGLVPSTQWKQTYFKDPEDKKWYPGETLPVAIGQGAVSTTPLQVARGLAAVVNGGLLLKPRVVRSVVTLDGRVLEEHLQPEMARQIDIDPAVLAQVRKAMVGVVNDEHGTGRKAILPVESGIIVGGKTGTAQSTSKEGSTNDHAWFAGYAPADKPEIVVVALVEHGGHGGVAAAPLVRQVMQAYFHIQPGSTEPKGVGTGTTAD